MGILLDWFAGADGIGARSCRAGLAATTGLSPTPLLCLTAVLTGAGTGLTALRDEKGRRRARARFLSARADGKGASAWRRRRSFVAVCGKGRRARARAQERRRRAVAHTSSRRR